MFLRAYSPMIVRQASAAITSNPGVGFGVGVGVGDGVGVGT